MNWDTDRTWTYAQISLLWEMALNRAPILEIGARVGKPYEDICAKAAELGISLPAERPFHRRYMPATAGDATQTAHAAAKAQPKAV
jgi:hypothetical protein